MIPTQNPSAERGTIDIVSELGRVFMAVEPHPEPSRTGQQSFAPFKPERERYDDIAGGRDRRRTAVRRRLKQLPAVGYDLPLLDDERHRHAP